MDPLTMIGIGAKILPWLLGLIGTPKTNEIAGKITNVAQEVFGTTDPKVIEARIAEANADAEKFKARLEAETEEYKAYLADVADARARDVEVRKASGGTNARANVMLAGAFSCAVVCIVVLGFKGQLSEAVITALTLALGSFLKMIGDAFQFEFGSSRSSAEKTDTLTALASRK